MVCEFSEPTADASLVGNFTFYSDSIISIIKGGGTAPWTVKYPEVVRSRAKTD